MAPSSYELHHTWDDPPKTGTPSAPSYRHRAWGSAEDEGSEAVHPSEEVAQGEVNQGAQEGRAVVADSAALGETAAARAHPSEGGQGKGAEARASCCDQHPGSPLRGEEACPRRVEGPEEPTPKVRRYQQGRCTEHGKKECWRR